MRNPGRNISRQNHYGGTLEFRPNDPANAFEKFHKEDIEESIPARFEKQACKHPARPAVRVKGQGLTYEELNIAANRVAHSILACCGRAEEPIALVFKQGAPLIIAMLGAMKAGKACVPLDESLPRAKAVQVLEDVQTRLILTDGDHLSSVHELAGAPCKALNVEQLSPGVACENPGLAISPNQIAYIHYTSGSTGEPKGVVWNHRNELYGILLKTNALHISCDDRVSLLRSNNVGATRDMLLALLNGACLFPLEVKDAGLANLGKWLIDEEISVYTSVATVFRHSLRSLAENDKLPSVRLVHIGGEPVTKTDVDLYRKHFSDECQFVNRYSISETQAISYYFINKQTEIIGERVPVGYPLGDNEVLILDESGNRLGANQTGQIAVRSWCLASGYWRRPELTSTKFLPDPTGGGTRMYLTGDLGYMLPDGCLVHVGRMDFQAKIRGHKVEMTEVEMTLLEICGVKEAAVISSDSSDDAKRLIAYIVPQQGYKPTTRELRRLLRAKIAAHMLPSQFVILDSLPLTTSGKIDRRALPAPKDTRSTLDVLYVEPRTVVERVLAGIWADAMGIDRVGAHDDFSELGGDSLTAAQIVAKVNHIFSLRIPVKTLFGTPTVSSLADYVLAHENRSGDSDKTAEVVLKIRSMSAEDVRTALKEQG
jgi:amino acid adenylation domain-containing protein